jgi:hypothetical protein
MNINLIYKEKCCGVRSEYSVAINGENMTYQYHKGYNYTQHYEKINPISNIFMNILLLINGLVIEDESCHEQESCSVSIKIIKYISDTIVPAFTLIEDTNKQLKEELEKKDAEIVELKQHIQNNENKIEQSEKKEVIMRDIIQTIRTNFAMKIEELDKQINEKSLLNEDVLKINNCRMVNLNKRIVNLTKQTEERSNLCDRLIEDLATKDKTIDELKNELIEMDELKNELYHHYEESLKKNQEIDRLNYLLINGISNKNISYFSPEF